MQFSVLPQVGICLEMFSVGKGSVILPILLMFYLVLPFCFRNFILFSILYFYLANYMPHLMVLKLISTIMLLTAECQHNGKLADTSAKSFFSK